MLVYQMLKCPYHHKSSVTLDHGCLRCLRAMPQYRQVVPNAERLYYKRAKEAGTGWRHTANWIRQQFENPSEFKPFVIPGGKSK